MKKSTRDWLIFATVLVLLGAAGFCAMMTRLHWDFTALGAAEYRTETAVIRDGFRSVNINGDVEDITLLPATDGQCRVEFCDLSSVKHKTEVGAEGVLFISREDERSGLGRLSQFGSETPRITVYLPEREYVTLTVRTDTGDVVIPGDFLFGQILIWAGTGDVSCAASSVTELRIETSTGDIRLEGVTAESVTLSVSTGDVSLKGLSCRSLVSEGSTGRLCMEDVIAAEAITVKRSTGDVEFTRCDALTLSITTGTGDVEGSLLSTKQFTASSSTGKVQLPPGGGEGSCRISTNTGDIRITLA